MLGEHHLFKEEFPEYKQKITELKQSNTEFAELYHQYINTDNEIMRLEQDTAAHTVEEIDELKKKLMMLKVRLYWLISQE